MIARMNDEKVSKPKRNTVGDGGSPGASVRGLQGCQTLQIESLPQTLTLGFRWGHRGPATVGLPGVARGTLEGLHP